MSNDLTLDAVDAIAAAKCAEIDAMRVLSRLSPEDQRRLRHDFGFMGRAGTFTLPGTMTFKEAREAVHCGETFPSGKTRGQEVAENLAETFAFTMKNPHVDRVAVLAQIIDAERAAAVKEERERCAAIASRTANAEAKHVGTGDLANARSHSYAMDVCVKIERQIRGGNS